MKPFWDFILSSLRESLSKQSGQSLTGIAIVLILLAVLIPIYLVMKLFRTSGTIEVRAAQARWTFPFQSCGRTFEPGTALSLRKPHVSL